MLGGWHALLRAEGKQVDEGALVAHLRAFVGEQGGGHFHDVAAHWLPQPLGRCPPGLAGRCPWEPGQKVGVVVHKHQVPAMASPRTSFSFCAACSSFAATRSQTSESRSRLCVERRVGTRLGGKVVQARALACTTPGSLACQRCQRGDDDALV